jgi:hypothetical protein
LHAATLSRTTFIVKTVKTVGHVVAELAAIGQLARKYPGRTSIICEKHGSLAAAVCAWHEPEFQAESQPWVTSCAGQNS